MNFELARLVSISVAYAESGGRLLTFLIQHCALLLRCGRQVDRRWERRRSGERRGKREVSVTKSQLPIIINRQSLPYIHQEDNSKNQYIEHSMSTEEKEPVAAKEEDEEEEDLEKLQAEIARMEAEAARIAQETEDLDKSAGEAAASTSVAAEGKKSDADTTNKDGHSIYVGQVDYSTTPEELLAHFESCGTVERVTIVCDKFTVSIVPFFLQMVAGWGRDRLASNSPSVTDAAVENALKLDGSTFKERQLKVTPKRVNDPNFYAQQGGGYQGRGRGRGRGRGGGFQGRGRGRGGYGRGGGRGFRGRGRGYNPY
eukprot:scaffold1811_cov145-Skeletonema_menzelii.AAC.22